MKNKNKILNKYFSSSGFTIIELLLASSVGLVLMYAMTNASNVAIQSARTSRAMLAERDLHRSVTGVLGNAKDCEWNLSPSRLTGDSTATGQTIESLVEKATEAEGQLVLVQTKTDTEAGDFKKALRIFKLELRQISGAPSEEQREFIVYYERKRLGRYKAKGSVCNGTDTSGCHKMTCKMLYKSPFLKRTDPASQNNCRLLDCQASRETAMFGGEKVCPIAHYLKGFNADGAPLCIPFRSCDKGELVTGFDPTTGEPKCTKRIECEEGKRLMGITANGGPDCKSLEEICTSAPINWNWDDKCKMCRPTCGTGTTWNDKECTCLCSATTPCESSKKWDTNLCTCIDRCSGVYRWSQTCNRCYAPCTGGKTYDHSSCSCVNCSGATPKWNGSSCVSCEAFNSATPKWNGSNCVSCPSFSSTKPKWNGSSCVSCEAFNSAKPKRSGSSCVACPSSRPRYYSSNNTCRASGCPSNRPRWSGSSCVACPSSRPKYYSSTNTCRACPSSRPRYYSSNNTCRASGCPFNRPRWSGSSCVACPSSRPKYKSSTNTCITCYAFDSTKPEWDSSIGCISCDIFLGGSNVGFWNGSRCVTCRSLDQIKVYWNGSECTYCPDDTVERGPDNRPCVPWDWTP